MTADPIVYRSTDPAVLAAVEAAWQAIGDYAKQIRATLDGLGLGEYKHWSADGGWHPGEFRGIDIPQDQFPPDGWRMKGDFAVPDKRKAAGKRAWKALSEVRHPGDPRRALIGMPPDLLTPGGYQSCGLRRINSAIYATWRNCDPAGAVGSFSAASSEIDASLWERIPLSEYYAAVEADEAAEDTAR